jgi:CheY-like chemotaxis protein
MTQRILIVEDDEEIRSLLADILVDQGYVVATAPDGDVALARVGQCPPDLILLDYQMPRCNGPTFSAAYRQLPGRHAPIVLLTAAASAHARAAEIGADAFVAKPFDLDRLLTVVERYTTGTQSWAS